MQKATKGHSPLRRSFVAFVREVYIQEATAGFEPAHKGFAGPRRVFLGPFAVLVSPQQQTNETTY